VNERELQNLESELERLLCTEPPPGLRAGVARRVKDELRRRPLDWLTYVALAAAALVLWANLSWTVSRGTVFVESLPPTDAEAVAQLRELLPEMSETEVRRQALVLRGAAHLPDGNATRRAATLGVAYY
jgi:hypothetical protein